MQISKAPLFVKPKKFLCTAMVFVDPGSRLAIRGLAGMTGCDTVLFVGMFSNRMRFSIKLKESQAGGGGETRIG